MRSRPVLYLGVVAVLFLLSAMEVSADTVAFGSNGTWTVTNSSNVNIGNAQAVCLNASSPSPCPSGATLYGYGGSGWGANLSSIPGAQWIWAPGVSGSTPNAALALYNFTSTFNLAGTPTSGSISVGADDFASVMVNGNFVGSVGSTTVPQGGSQSALTTFDISAYLVSGNNTITVTGQNGVFSFGCSSPSPCTYSQHPAGVVFGGALNYTPQTTTVPEPATFALLATGLVGLFLRRRSER